MARGGRIRSGGAGETEANVVNAAAARGGQAVNRRQAGGWRVAEPEAGDPVFICPGCWPAVAAYWQAKPDATVRVVGRRPEWARCGICDPERVC